MSQQKAQSGKLNIDRLVYVSNRLPIAITRDDEGEWQVKPSTGGLANALTPILRERGGLLIGWAGMLEEAGLDELLVVGSKNAGYMLKPVELTQDEVEQYYFGFSNEIIWPLFHDLQSRCNFDPAYWNAYQAVNRKFARVITQNVSASGARIASHGC
jgi:trehalose 6-phosphate synthase